MTDNREQLPEPPARVSELAAEAHDGATRDPAAVGVQGGGSGQNEMAGLVLVINTVLGGLGTLYVTTKSSAITLASALMVLLIIVVVLVVKRGNGRERRPGRKDDWSGR